MRMKFISKIIVMISLTLSSLNSYAQYASIEELKSTANKLFQEEDYEGSLQLYAQLLSTYPKDPIYNYKYGACVLFGSRDKEDALRFLEFATTKPNVDPIAFYFLGKSYHHEFKFSKAIESYNLFKAKASSKELNKYDVDREIEMCQNGKNLLKNILSIGVLGKKETKESDFFRSYSLKGIGGKIIVKPAEFKTKLDKKKNEKSLLYLNKSKDIAVFSSYGEDGKNERDIFKSVRNSYGDWEDPVSFGDNVNSPFDEDYPFLHPDGKTLYFSSKGHSSMGGYDIFKSTYDENTQEWSVPKNLDFPINTPNDDILYISDAENKLAYFASSRASKQGELTVYNVAVEAVPLLRSVVSGVFMSESKPTMKSATITVAAADKDEQYGVYETSPETGEYLLVFPSNGGKYKILVETTTNAPVHTATIEIPAVENLRALKQQLKIVGEGDEEKLLVNNLFEESEEFDINSPEIVQNILKQGAKMEVNTTELEVDSIINDKVAQKDEVIVSNNLKNSLENNTLKEDTKEVDPVAEKEEATTEVIVVEPKVEAQEVVSYEQTYEEELSKIDTAETPANSILKAKVHEEWAAAIIEDIAAKKTQLLSVELEKRKALEQEIAVLEVELLKQQELAEISELQATIIEEEKELEDVELGIVAEKEEATAEVIVIEPKVEAQEIVSYEQKYEEELSKIGTTETPANSILKAKVHEEWAAAIVEDIAAKKTQLLSVELEKRKALEQEIAVLEVELLKQQELAETSELQATIIEEATAEVIVIEPKVEAQEIVSYEQTYEEELSKIDTAETPANSILKAKVHEEWAAAIVEDIAAKKTQLLSVELEKRKALEQEIAVLEVELLRQQELAETSELQATIIEEEKELEDVELGIVAEKEEATAEVIVIEPKVEAQEIVSYEQTYEEELSKIDTAETPANSILKAKVHEEWAAAIIEDIAAKKTQLLSVELEKRKALEQEIQALEMELLKQQELTALFALQATVMGGNVKELENAELGIVAEKKKPKTEVVVIEQKDVSQRVVNYEQKYEEELSKIGTAETPANLILKAKIHEDWAEAIQKDMATKKKVSSNATELEKENLANELEELKYKMFEHEEFSSLYLIQASVLQKELDAAQKLLAEKTSTDSAVVDSEIVAISTPSKNENDTLKENEEGKDELTDLDELASENVRKDNLKAEEIIEEVSVQDTTTPVVDELEEEILEQEVGVELIKSQELVEEPEIEDANVEEKVGELESLELGIVAEKEDATPEVVATESKVTEQKVVNYEEKYREALSKIGAAETPSNLILKAKIHRDWAKSIQKDMATKKEVSLNATGLEKENLANELEELAYKMFEQEEFSSLYLIQAGVLQKELDAAQKLLAEKTSTDSAVVDSEIVAISTPSKNENDTLKENEEGKDELADLDELASENVGKDNLNTDKEELSDLKDNNLSNLRTPQFDVEAPLSESEKQLVSSMQASEIRAVRELDNYKTFAQLNQQKRRLMKEAQTTYLEAKKLEKDNNNKSKVAALMSSIIDKETTVKSLNNQMNSILEGEDVTQSNRIKTIERVATFDEGLMASLMSISANTAPSNKKEADTLTPTLVVDYQFPSILKQNIFEKDDDVLDSNRNKLYVAPKLPDSLVFQVQLGMYRNDFPQSYFNYFHPIIVEDKENDMNRYAAGLFMTLSAANNAKDAIRAKGYTNPFVVALYDGKEIEMTKARKMLGIKNAENDFANNIPNVDTVIFTETIVEEVDEESVSSDEKAMKGEMYYAVQIGVYSKPVDVNSPLNNFSPLNTQVTKDGLIRYATGKFNTLESANEAKANIRINGIPDAFIIAYYKGIKISVSENQSKKDTVKITPKITTEEVKDGISTDVRNIAGVFFSVQVGLYSKEVNSESPIRKISPLNSERTKNGLIRYSTGKFKTLESANVARTTIVNNGISDAFVVAYHNGVRISVAEARKLLKLDE